MLLPLCVLLLVSSPALDSRTRKAGDLWQARETVEQQWRLTFHLSGGVAGFDRKLDVSSNGIATASDLRRKREVTRQVPRDDLQELDRLVSSAVSADVPSRTRCADCLSYSIDLRTSRTQVTIHARDDSLADSPVGPLIEALSSLLNQSLSEP